MPVLHHPSFDEPPETAMLWRYMDLARFAALITSSRLWFSSLKSLALEDPLEGKLPRSHYSHREWTSVSDVSKRDMKIIEARDYGVSGLSLDEKIRFERKLREMHITHSEAFHGSYYVNCWHMADYESVAMWKIYGAPGPGIAIKTSTGSLKSALTNHDKQLYIGKLKYIDRDEHLVQDDNAFNVVLIKNRQYGHEAEVRIVFSDQTGGGADGEMSFVWDEGSQRFGLSSGLDAFTRRARPAGLAIDCPLDELIGEVWISPYSPAWYAKTVKKLCSLAGVRAQVRSSTILDP